MASAWEWQNLLLACAECDTLKASWFPLVEEAARVAGPTADISQEQPLLLDPCIDDPDLRLRFLSDGRVQALTARGAASIEILNLNRSALLERRYQQIRELYKKLEIVKAIRQEVASEALSRIASAALADLQAVCRQQQQLPYQAAQRHCLLEWISTEPTLLRLLAVESGNLFLTDTQAAQPAKQAKSSTLTHASFNSNLGRLTTERIELRNFKNIRVYTD